MEIAIARDALGRPLPGLEQNVHEVKSGDLTANWIAATRRSAGQRIGPKCASLNSVVLSFFVSLSRVTP